MSMARRRYCFATTLFVKYEFTPTIAQITSNIFSTCGDIFTFKKPSEVSGRLVTLHTRRCLDIALVSSPVYLHCMFKFTNVLKMLTHVQVAVHLHSTLEDFQR